MHLYLLPDITVMKFFIKFHLTSWGHHWGLCIVAPIFPACINPYESHRNYITWHWLIYINMYSLCDFLIMFTKMRNISLLLSQQTEYARFENGRYVFRIHRSPLCEYMINFIHKLKHLPEKYMMNSVLENFTILQVNSRCVFLKCFS